MFRDLTSDFVDKKVINAKSDDIVDRKNSYSIGLGDDIQLP